MPGRVATISRTRTPAFRWAVKQAILKCHLLFKNKVAINQCPWNPTFEVKGCRAKAQWNRHVKANESICYVCIQMHRLPFCITTASGTSVIITIIKRISRVPIYLTRWQYRPRFIITLTTHTDTDTDTHRHRHTQTHAHIHKHTKTYTHTHTHTHTRTHARTHAQHARTHARTHTHTHTHTHTREKRWRS